MPDPLPLPEEGPSGKRRSLAKKHKLLYAPLSDIESVLVDADAVYIDIPENQMQFSDVDGILIFFKNFSIFGRNFNIFFVGKINNDDAGDGVKMVKELQKGGISLDDRAGGEMRLFADQVKKKKKHMKNLKKFKF